MAAAYKTTNTHVSTCLGQEETLAARMKTYRCARHDLTTNVVPGQPTAPTKKVEDEEEGNESPDDDSVPC